MDNDIAKERHACSQSMTVITPSIISQLKIHVLQHWVKFVI